MRSYALALSLFSVLTIVHAYAIPFRRVKIPTSNLIQISNNDVHRRQELDVAPATINLSSAGSDSNIFTTLALPTQGLAIPSPRSITFEPSGFVVTIKRANSTSSPTLETSTSEDQRTTTSVKIASTSSATLTTSSPSTSSSAPSSATQLPASSISAPLPSPSQPPVDSDGSRKYVVAHHMVGNTFPYKTQDWADDIALAHASGIDGFALNIGRDEWEPARVADAYQAALDSKLDFKLFISLDMSSLPCNSPNDAEAIRNLVKAYANHANQLLYDKRAFVSTFAGESCQFGQGSAADGWKTQFYNHPDLKGIIYFVPAFFIDPAKFGDFAEVMDGDFNWNSGWPIQVTTAFAKDLLTKLSEAASDKSPKILDGILSPITSVASTATSSNLNQLNLALGKLIGSVDSDKEHLQGLAALSGALNARDGEGESKRAYMGAVSPWFFTHYGKNSFNKNFIFLSDQHLYSKRWESLVDSRDQFDIVQVLTWNDYGESHYIGPIKGDQPDSEAWTDGMNHTAWLDLTQYYATAFKTGQYPKIEKDKIFMWSRPHASNAQSSDPVPQPDNFELSEDSVWAVVMTTAPSTVTLSTSPISNTSFDVPAGLTKLAVPISPGGTMKGTIVRDGKVVVALSPTPDEFTFQGSPKTYNYNAFVASAIAE